MSKLACQCGHIMVVHTMEEDFLYDLISQRKIMDLLINGMSLEINLIQKLSLVNTINLDPMYINALSAVGYQLKNPQGVTSLVLI